MRWALKYVQMFGMDLLIGRLYEGPVFGLKIPILAGVSDCVRAMVFTFLIFVHALKSIEEGDFYMLSLQKAQDTERTTSARLPLWRKAGWSETCNMLFCFVIKLYFSFNS